MNGLIAGLLSYAHATSGEHEATEVDAEDALRAALDNLHAAAEEAKAQITHDPLPKVTANPVQLARLFQNLIGNAIKYCRADASPEVYISAKHEDEGWLFIVKDNGIGIEEQYLPRVFGLFQRLHGQNRSGAGVGLATAQRIVERLHGRIWAESVVGQGSTFFFTIPDSPPAA